MYFDEHNPPHFHAIYGNREAQIGIDPITLLEGRLPNRAIGMVIEWAALHQTELSKNWQRMRNDLPPLKIDPLE